MSRLLFGVVALVALAAGLVAAPEVAGATDPPVTCGSTITTDTVLTRDLACIGDGLYVAEGATLDLGRHTVTRTEIGPYSYCGSGLIDPVPDGSGCAVAADGTVRNGTVIGGIYSSGVFERVRIKGGVAAIASGVIRSSTAIDVTVRGIQSVTVESSTLIRSGVSVDNQNWGLGLYLRNNRIFDSPGDSVRMQLGGFVGPDDVGAEITGNLIVNSGGAGITAGGFFADFRPSEVAHNIVWGSASDGIRWPGEEQNPAIPSSLSGPMSVDHNLVVANGGHGIVTGPITVGNTKGNIALFNQTPPQCIGVQCGPFFRFGFPGL
jgi:hypothetical protein